MARVVFLPGAEVAVRWGLIMAMMVMQEQKEQQEEWGEVNQEEEEAEDQLLGDQEAMEVMLVVVLGEAEAV